MPKISELVYKKTVPEDLVPIVDVDNYSTKRTTIGDIRGDIYVRTSYFERVSQTTGEIEIPSYGTYIYDNWAEGVDLLTSEIDSYGKPTFITPRDSNGQEITAIVTSTGSTVTLSYELSSNPVSTISVIYPYRCLYWRYDYNNSLDEVNNIEHIFNHELLPTIDQKASLDANVTLSSINYVASIDNVIRNNKFDAIVESGLGNINDAIERGCRTLFLKSGTHILSNSFIVDSEHSIDIEGESPSTTFLDFNGFNIVFGDLKKVSTGTTQVDIVRTNFLTAEGTATIISGSGFDFSTLDPQKYYALAASPYTKDSILRVISVVSPTVATVETSIASQYTGPLVVFEVENYLKMDSMQFYLNNDSDIITFDIAQTDNVTTNGFGTHYFYQSLLDIPLGTTEWYTFVAGGYDQPAIKVMEILDSTTARLESKWYGNSGYNECRFVKPTKSPSFKHFTIINTSTDTKLGNVFPNNELFKPVVYRQSNISNGINALVLNLSLDEINTVRDDVNYTKLTYDAFGSAWKIENCVIYNELYAPLFSVFENTEFMINMYSYGKTTFLDCIAYKNVSSASGDVYMNCRFLEQVPDVVGNDSIKIIGGSSPTGVIIKDNLTDINLNDTYINRLRIGGNKQTPQYSDFETRGTRGRNVQTVTTNNTILNGYDIIFLNISDDPAYAGFVLGSELPGREMTIKNIGINDVHLLPDDTGTIEGSSDFVLSTGDSITIISDGTDDWKII